MRRMRHDGLDPERLRAEVAAHAAEGHLTDEELCAHGGAGETPAAADRARQHLEACAFCRAELAETQTRMAPWRGAAGEERLRKFTERVRGRVGLAPQPRPTVPGETTERAASLATASAVPAPEPRPGTLGRYTASASAEPAPEPRRFPITLRQEGRYVYGAVTLPVECTRVPLFLLAAGGTRLPLRTVAGAGASGEERWASPDGSLTASLTHHPTGTLEIVLEAEHAALAGHRFEVEAEGEAPAGAHS